MTNVEIASEARTADGAFGGGFAGTSAHYPGAVILEAEVARAKIEKGEIAEAVLGRILIAMQGQNPARQARINAGLKPESLYWSIKQLCSSGLRAVALDAHHIQPGDVNIVAGGGRGNMTMSPHAKIMRAGHKISKLKLVYTMVLDGLWYAFNGYHRGQTSDSVANNWQISRELQDAFAVASQNKTEAAQNVGKFADEIAPFVVKSPTGGTIIDQGIYSRHGDAMEAMQELRPAFAKDRSVKASNTSGLNDGATVTLVKLAGNVEKRGIKPLARIASYATAGLDSSIMGVGSIYGSRNAVEEAGWKVEVLDLAEANEACAVKEELGWEPAIVNANGGAIAIGHLVGASGCRVLNTLLSEMVRRDANRSLATLYIGGGMGFPLSVERH